MTIARELASGVYPDIAGRISHESIYSAVCGHGRRGLPAGLHAGLHRRRRFRKHRRDLRLDRAACTSRCATGP